ARPRALAAAGWVVKEKSLTAAPPIRVFAGEQVHTTFPRALRFVGLGLCSLERLPPGAHGRLGPIRLRAALSVHEGPAIVHAKAGEVNTGSCDDFHAIADAAE